MSLEKQIEVLNENIVTLIAALQGRLAVDVGNRLVDEPAPKAPAKKKVAKKTPAKKAPAKKAPAKKTTKINYDRDVKPQVLMAIATPEGREEVKDLLATYDVVKAPDLDPDDYPDFLKGIEAIIEKYEDDDE